LRRNAHRETPHDPAVDLAVLRTAIAPGAAGATAAAFAVCSVAPPASVLQRAQRELAWSARSPAQRQLAWSARSPAKQPWEIARIDQACAATRSAIRRTRRAAARGAFSCLRSLRDHLLRELRRAYARGCRRALGARAAARALEGARLPSEDTRADERAEDDGRGLAWLAYPPIVTCGGPPAGARGLDRVHPRRFVDAPLASATAPPPPVLVDVGLRVGGYCADVSRSFPGCDRPLASLHRTLCRMVDELYERAVAGVRPGASWADLEADVRATMHAALRARAGCDPALRAALRALAAELGATPTATLDAATLDAATLDAATLDAATLDAATLDAATLDAATLDAATLDAATLDACMPHALGHMVGLQVHDHPSLDAHDILREGFVLTVEPGLYLGGASVRREDVLLVVPGGARVLGGRGHGRAEAARNGMHRRRSCRSE
jgi:Xaa-Pro aminopeptidase